MVNPVQPEAPSQVLEMRGEEETQRGKLVHTDTTAFSTGLQREADAISQLVT